MNGRVFLVGAGPGDPGLLTARALELIARADTILYDRLIPAEALEGARADAELLFVGKQGRGGVGAAGADRGADGGARAGGQVVVRLKGGDPFVFGRGGEEALALRADGHPVRGRARRHRGRGRHRLGGHPRHAPRARQCRGADHRAHTGGWRQRRGGCRGPGCGRC